MPQNTTNTRAASTRAETRAAAPSKSSSVPRYGGVVAAVVTPCRKPGTPDADELRRLCGILAGHGCDGLFVAGSSGELPLLDEDDRRLVIGAAREGTDEKTLIYAGVSGLGLKQTLRYARNAATDGADVAVVMAPFFLKLRQAELSVYIRAIADGSPIPVALYHHPRSATALNIETIAQVAEHPNVVAIKDTSLDLERTTALLQATASLDFTVLQGNERLIDASLRLGAGGMVSALANIVPEWHAELYQAATTGHTSEAAELQKKITTLWQMFALELVSKSISTFTYTLRLALKRRGWLETLDGMVDGFTPSDSLRRAVLDHLSIAGLPTAIGPNDRLDVAHSVISETRDVA